jgi:hypothetical protein
MVHCLADIFIISPALFRLSASSVLMGQQKPKKADNDMFDGLCTPKSPAQTGIFADYY